MTYYIPDLSGANPLYKVTNLKRRVHVVGQTIELFTPVFPDTLEVTIESSITVPMVKDVDWVINESDYDDHYTGVAQLTDPNVGFTPRLIKSFTITKPFMYPYNINCAFQQLYPNQIEYILTNPTENIEITPAVIWAMMQDIKNLSLAIEPVTDRQAGTVRSPKLYPPDPNKEYDLNLIDGEHWYIDTSTNNSIVYPLAGAFYRDSVRIVKGMHDSVDLVTNKEDIFTEDVEYYITGTDAYGVHHTSNPSGVYALIVFKEAYVGDITISYHAYGGKPTQYDLRAIADEITNVRTYITSAQFITSENIGMLPLMNEFRAKIKVLEDEMRKLANSGQPSYGDCTTGQSLVKKIASSDSEFHWWTIAELYKVAGSEAIFLSDVAHFQIQSLYTKLLLDLTVTVNIEHPSKKLNIGTLASLPPDNYVPFENDADLSNIVRPQLRIIYNDNSIEGSGIYLQYGMRLKNVAEETLVIADMSGMESCWKLIAKSDLATLPEDDDILLPSGNHYWSTDNTDSKTESCLIHMDRGHVCWAGNEPLNRPLSGWKEMELDHFLETEIDVSKIKSIDLWLEESESSRFIVNLPMCGTDYSTTGVNSFVYANKPASVVMNITRHQVTKELTMKLNAEISAGVNSNAVYLRYIHVNTQ